MDSNKKEEEKLFTKEERKLIRKTLYEMFTENRVAIVDRIGYELKAFEIWHYVLKRSKVK